MKITIFIVPDELAARDLEPKILEWFDQQISQNAMCVYLAEAAHENEPDSLCSSCHGMMNR